VVHVSRLSVRGMCTCVRGLGRDGGGAVGAGIVESVEGGGGVGAVVLCLRV